MGGRRDSWEHYAPTPNHCFKLTEAILCLTEVCRFTNSFFHKMNMMILDWNVQFKDGVILISNLFFPFKFSLLTFLKCLWKTSCWWCRQIVSLYLDLNEFMLDILSIRESNYNLRSHINFFRKSIPISKFGLNFLRFFESNSREMVSPGFLNLVSLICFALMISFRGTRLRFTNVSGHNRVWTINTA